MHYSELSKVYEALEKTTKRLEKTKILSDFFKKIKNSDEENVKEIAYLSKGKIFPDFSRLGRS
jgi:DNA ligase 1